MEQEHFSPQELMERVMDDRELAQEALEAFLETLPEQKEKIVQAHQGGSWDELAKAVHSIKGALGNISAPYCQKLALQLEQSAKKQDAKRAATAWQQLDPALEQLRQEIQQWLEQG